MNKYQKILKKMYKNYSKACRKNSGSEPWTYKFFKRVYRHESIDGLFRMNDWYRKQHEPELTELGYLMKCGRRVFDQCVNRYSRCENCDYLGSFEQRMTLRPLAPNELIHAVNKMHR